MKVSIIGTGSIGKRHLKNCWLLKDELGISEISCFDPNKERLDKIKQELPGVIVTNNLKEAVGGAEALFICVPTSLHIPVLKDIAREGDFNIYLEKPVSSTLAGCEDLVFFQKKANKVLVVGYLLPKHPVLLKVKEILETKILGRILSVRAESGFYLPKWHPWEDYRNFYMAWKTGGGGALLDASHEIHYLQWLFGDIAEVKGFVSKISDLEITSDDLALAIFRFANGISGELHLDLLQFEEARVCKIIGGQGVLIADLIANTIKYNTENDNAWKEIKLEVDFDKIYHEQLRDFIKACRGEQTSLITGEAAVKTMHVIEGVRRSHAYATAVKLPLFD